ncbi:MAG: MFS transporter [Candidatus Rokubacteria bacterium]|nr:MFS transporter [Candidatus Rokubacteria bacterium]
MRWSLLRDQPFVRATVTNFFFFGSLNGFVLLPLYIQQLGGTEIEIGLVMGLYPAVGIVLQPIIGPWVDAVGRKPFMVIGVVLVVISCVVAAVAPAIAVLGVVRLIQGVGFSAFFVSMFSYVIDLVPAAQRGWTLGIFGVSGFVSTALTPLLGEWVVRRFGFPTLFTLMGLVALVAFVLVIPIREQRRADVPVVRGWGWARDAMTEVMQRHMVISLFFGLGTGALFAFMPTYAESLGVRTLAVFYTGYAAAAIVVRVVGGRLIDTRGRRAVIVPSMFVQASAPAMLAALAVVILDVPWLPAVPVLMLAGLMSGGAHGFLYPALAALVADQAPEARRAAVIGVFSAMQLIGQTTGSMAFGYVAHAAGYAIMWSALAALLLIGSVLSIGLADTR